MAGIGIGVAYIASNEALKTYFIRNRNFTLGLAAGLSGLGNVIFPPLIQILIEDFGLCQMFLIVGALSAHIVPCALLFRPLRHQSLEAKAKAKESARSSFDCHSWTFLCLWDFYVLTANCLLYILGNSIVLAHLSAYTLERGVGNEQQASILYALMGGVLIVGKIVQGWLANLRQVRTRWLYMACYVLGGGCTLLLLLNLPLAVLYLYSVLFGFSYAAFGGALIPSLVIDIAGDGHFAFAYGIIICFCAISQFTGPPLAGWLHDETKSYKIPFALAAFFMLASGAIMLLRCEGQAANFKASREVTDVVVVEAGDVTEKLMDGKNEKLDFMDGKNEKFDSMDGMNDKPGSILIQRVTTI